MNFILLLILIFMMFFQPVAVFPSLANTNPLGKVAIFSLLVYISCKKEPSENFTNNYTNKYLLYFILAQFISTSLVWTDAAVKLANKWFLYIIFYYLIVKLVNSQERILAICFMIILPIHYLVYFSLSKFVIDYKPGVRAIGFGWYDNPNDLACILVSTIPLCLYASEYYNKKMLKYVMLFSAGLLSFTVLFTASRGGMLALLFVCAAGIFMSSKLSNFFKISIMGLLVISLVLIGLRNISDRGLDGNLTTDDSATDRLIQWRAGRRMLLDNPLFGVGSDGFEDHVAEYGGVPRLAPHNTIVLVFTETGIIGGFFFLIFAFKRLVKSISHIMKDIIDNKSHDKSLLATKYISIAIIGFWICAFLGNRDRDYILYVLVALLVSANNIHLRSSSQNG